MAECTQALGGWLCEVDLWLDGKLVVAYVSCNSLDFVSLLRGLKLASLRRRGFQTTQAAALCKRHNFTDVWKDDSWSRSRALPRLDFHCQTGFCEIKL